MKKALVTVYKPCTCGASRWFLHVPACPGRWIVAEYDCQAYDDGSPDGSFCSPTAEAVAWVRAQYPTDTLVYLD